MDYKRLKLACYTTNLSMSIVGNLSPLLFLTFRSLYGISYSLLGLLVLTNFVTQLLVDLAFSFFSHRFNIPFAVKATPALSCIGLIVYAIWPFFFPNAVYVGLVIGTIIFSASSGLAEVLISPVIAAIPSDDPDREMSKLHSIYAWGVVAVVLVSTFYLLVFGSANWQWLPLLFVLVPLTGLILYLQSEIPKMETPEKVSGVLQLLKNKGLWLCVGAIFLGGATECTMAQWCSGYLEKALDIPKVWGDIGGVMLFAAMLGLGRSLYAKMGKNVARVLLLGAIGATVCYFTAAVSNLPLLGLIACGFTGFCASMLWPGSLIVASDRFPAGGVFIYAMMAAGGDLGASIAPQLMGVVVDTVSVSYWANRMSAAIGLTSEQIGMKAGMLTTAVFPILGVLLILYIKRYFKKHA